MAHVVASSHRKPSQVRRIERVRLNDASKSIGKNKTGSSDRHRTVMRVRWKMGGYKKRRTTINGPRAKFMPLFVARVLLGHNSVGCEWINRRRRE
jgi:hypothetical protein